jgi:hypothetical protein
LRFTANRLRQGTPKGDVWLAGEAHRLCVSTSLALWPEDRQRVEALIRPATAGHQAQACPGGTVVV